MPLPQPPTTTAHSKTLRNAAAGFLTGFAVSTFFCFFFLVELWARNGPTDPDPARGLIYSHNEHGWVTYFSAFQTTASFLLFSTFPIILLIGFALAPKQHIRVSRRWFAWSMDFEHDDPEKALIPALLVGVAVAPVALATAGPGLVAALVSHGLVLNLG
jgi:hypothetical protein